MNFIEALKTLKKFESHDIEGIGKVNILKPTLAQAQSFEEFASSLDETEGMEVIAKQVEKIGLEFIVDDDAKPIFTEDNVAALKDAPVDILVEIIGAFKATFEKISIKADDIEKKHSAQK